MAYPYYPYYPYQQVNQQSYQQEADTMHWVDGEVGAKAFQKPLDIPVNKPIALWDSTEKRVYLKSWNQMGMANPMQELTYEIKEHPNPIIIENTSSSTGNYATKEDFESLKQELKSIHNSISNLSNNRNRGGQN